jgi:hypothetical protein
MEGCEVTLMSEVKSLRLSTANDKELHTAFVTFPCKFWIPFFRARQIGFGGFVATAGNTPDDHCSQSCSGRRDSKIHPTLKSTTSIQGDRNQLQVFLNLVDCFILKP